MTTYNEDDYPILAHLADLTEQGGIEAAQEWIDQMPPLGHFALALEVQKYQQNLINAWYSEENRLVREMLNARNN